MARRRRKWRDEGTCDCSTPPHHTLKLPLKHAIRDTETLAELHRGSKHAARVFFRALMTVRLYLLKLFEAGEILPVIDHDIMQDAIHAICRKPTTGIPAKEAKF